MATRTKSSHMTVVKRQLIGQHTRHIFRSRKGCNGHGKIIELTEEDAQAIVDRFGIDFYEKMLAAPGPVRKSGH